MSCTGALAANRQGLPSWLKVVEGRADGDYLALFETDGKKSLHSWMTKDNYGDYFFWLFYFQNEEYNLTFIMVILNSISYIYVPIVVFKITVLEKVTRKYRFECSFLKITLIRTLILYSGVLGQGGGWWRELKETNKSPVGRNIQKRR
jgi:hypothetical protein